MRFSVAVFVVWWGFLKVSDFDTLADSLLLLTSLLLACEAFFFDPSMFSFNEAGWSLFCCCSTN